MIYKYSKKYELNKKQIFIAMAEFKNILKEIFLNEIGVTYQIPTSKELLIYDFYVINYLDFVINNFPEKREDQNLKNSVEYAVSTLYPFLKKELLNSTFYSICAEIRHSINQTNIKLEVPKNLKPLWETYLKHYTFQLEKYKSPTFQTTANILGLRKYRIRNYGNDIENVSKNKTYKMSYQSAIKAIEKTSSTKQHFVLLSKFIYRNGLWEDNYGGQAWENICDGWLRLNAAQNKNDMAIAIDHVYDLQHNTNTVFNKLKSYAIDYNYDWIRDALDKKANVKSYYELIQNVSPRTKKMTLAILKNYKIGSKDSPQSYEDYLKKQSPKNRKLSVGVPTPSSISGKPKKTWKGVTWETGTWKNGIWEYGVWENGTWENGTWENGTWENGTWITGIWKDGIWKKGIWKEGIWKDGTWIKGIWYNGTWQGGIWKTGTWENGTWKYGFWKNGTWEDGTWKYGFWKNGTWEDGTWENGVWQGGIWKTGTWKTGTWKDGIWENGTWENGTWKYGFWKNGTWKSGWIYDPKLNKHIRSRVSPKEYFDKSNNDQSFEQI